MEKSDLLCLNDLFYMSSYQQALARAFELAKQLEEERSIDSEDGVSSDDPNVLLLDMGHGLSW